MRTQKCYVQLNLVRIVWKSRAVQTADLIFRKAIDMLEANVNRTLIGKSLIIKGEVTGLEAMHIEGRVEGSIALPGQTITVGRNGQTAAMLIANEIVVLGQVLGSCEASDHLDIRSEGSMNGDAIVSRISIADGAFVKGNIDVRRS
jgi:cytoskeletal protein CcmA (bactofilin family)